MKTVGIEEFAAWAVQEEWPKANSADMDEHSAARVAVLGAMGFREAPLFPSGFGSMDWDFLVAEGSVRAAPPRGVPHPDAVLFAKACSALAVEAGSPAYDVADCLTDQAPVLELGADERLAADWRASEHLQVNRINPRSLVVTYAGLARRRRSAAGWDVERPDWHPDAIERGYQLAETGGHPQLFVTVQRRVRVSGRGEPAAYEVRPFEEEGRDPKTRRPKPGAYRKVVFDPDPGFVARARHTYAVWWCAMEYLAAWMEASSGLSEHRVLGPQGVEKPWQSARKRVA
jgi:hypothetical protein